MSQALDGKPADDEKKRVVYVVTQEGCPPCAPYKEMAVGAAPKDVIVKEIKLGDNPDVDSLVLGLGVRSTPTAMYVDDGVVNMVSSSGEHEEDRNAFLGIMEPTRKGAAKEAAGGCAAEFEIKGDSGYRVKLKGGEACEEAAAEANLQGPGVRKNLAQRLESDDPAVKELLGRLRKK
jgi:hypothetical protein